MLSVQSVLNMKMSMHKSQQFSFNPIRDLFVQLFFIFQNISQVESRAVRKAEEEKSQNTHNVNLCPIKISSV